MANDVLEVELKITDDNAEVVLSKGKKLLKDFVEEAKKAQPQIKFSIPNQNYIDLDKLEKRAEQTRKVFAETVKFRLDNGQFGILTKEIFQASERARVLQNDISGIKKELANPNRKSSIAFLTEELRAAEREADQLDRKLSTLSNSQTASGSTGIQKRNGGRGGGRISYNQATFLELADDFAPQGLNRPFNAAGRAIFAAQNAKEAAGEMGLLNGISTATLATFGAIAAAGFGIVKVTEQIKSEAERRLHSEELIAGAINKQVIGLRDAFAEYEKFKASAINDKAFTNRLATYVGTYDTKAILAERAKVEAKNNSSIVEANRLQSQLAQNERSLEFEKGREVRQNLFSEIGIGSEYTASQKEQNISQATLAIEKTKKALTDQEQALEKGKSALEQTHKALIDVRNKQDEYFAQRGEAFKKSQELAIKAEQSALENNYNVQNALLERNVQLGINTQEQGYSESLRRRQNFIAEEINVQARFFDAQLSLYSNDAVKTVEITAQRNETIRKLNTESRIAEINAQKELFQKKTEFRDALISAKGDFADNPFVKMFSDIDTAGERAQKRFGLLGKEAVKLAADAERANLQKTINIKDFDNRFAGLKLRQDAARLAATPDTQFADFKRALETVEHKTDALAKIFALDKQISEADFYARTYNPNNPKTFDQSRFSFAERDRFSEIAGDRRRGETLQDFEKRRKEAIEIGIKTFDAIKDLEKFKNFSLEGTGVLGSGIIADKILEAIPKREDLLKQLDSPYAQTRENAQFLLSEQGRALTDKREAERKKLENFLEDQKTNEFGKKFAYEQIDLINNDKNLTGEQKAQRRLSVADALGNDLDPRLKRQKIQDYFIAAQAKEDELEKARKIAEDTKDLVDKIVTALTKDGIKIDPKALPKSNVNVKVEDSPTSKSSISRATPDDTAQGMDLSSYVQLNFMQRPKTKK